MLLIRAPVVDSFAPQVVGHVPAVGTGRRAPTPAISILCESMAVWESQSG